MNVALRRMNSPQATHRYFPKSVGLLELIRAKREWTWKPSVEELRKGFRGWHQRGYLPHFDAPGVTQFITFQLHDSFPITRREEFEADLKEADDSAKRRKIEAWLDRGHGKSWLSDPAIADLVEKAVLSCDGKTYRLHAWAMMPNHVHLVVEVWEVPLAKLINNWKGSSARAANQLLSRTGPFWQKDYFDALVRDEAHLKRAIRYTENNPTKAHLVKTALDWKWSSARHRDKFDRLPWQQT
jgi:REP element-mobilizing transposase RayT